MVRIVSRTQQWLLDLLFPRRCVGCGVNGSWVCKECAPVVSLISSEISGLTVTSLFDFSPIVRELLHSLKYNGISEAAESLIASARRSVLVDEVRGVLGENCVLVPVPTSKAKLKERGYNQAELLAQELSKWLSIPVVNVLERTGKKRSQVGHSAEERKVGVEDQFRMCSEIEESRRIVLVDDIYTTGSTLLACAKCLEGRDVAGLTIAHER